MTSTELVSFKAYLAGDGDDATNCEVRRFAVPRHTSTSFAAIKNKLAAVFPELNGSSMKLTWTDDDNDDVVISSDEELALALKEMGGPVYKINVAVSEKKEASQMNSGVVHENVICDGCDGAVVGFRFKCVVCPDFDLCSCCQAEGLHPYHEMVRVSDSKDARARYFLKYLHRCNETWDSWSQRKNISQGNEANQKAKRAASAILAGLKLPNAMKASAQQHLDAQPAPSKGNEYLMSVGNMVAAALDPLGVDVEIHIEHHGQRSDIKKPEKEEEKKEEEAQEEEKPPKYESFKEEIPEEKSTADEDDGVIVDQNLIDEKPAAELEDNSDDEEWLLVKQDD